MVVIGIGAAEVPSGRSNTLVFAASDTAALHRHDFVVDSPMFVAVTRCAAAHTAVDPVAAKLNLLS